MALMAANSSRPKRYEIQQKDDEATIYLYDVIDPYWGVSASQFVKDLAALKAKTIHLRINSPGGDVFDGRAIATAIAQHPAKMIAHVDGLAASAASYVAIAAAEVEMAPGSFLMIHKAWTVAYGNADDLVATAGVLEKIDASLVADYAKHTGKSEEQIATWMAEETWFSAEEAVSEGFAHRVAEDTAEKPKDSASNRWDLAAYQKPPIEAAVLDEAALNHEDAELAHAGRMRYARLLETVA
jgi:ATP-dependent Clp protease protease subunit